MERNPGYFSEIVYLRAFAILAVIGIHESEYFFTVMSVVCCDCAIPGSVVFFGSEILF